jgi:F0F1-type ATP synthase membrane subunit b/b'
MPNQTALIELGLFLLSFVILKFLIFDPYVKLIHLREAKTTGLKESAEKARQEAEKYRVDYDEFLKGERKKLNQMVEEERRKISDEGREIIQASRGKAMERLEGLRKQVDADSQRARQELTPMVGEFSSKIASKLVGFNVTISGSAQKKSKSTEATQ